MVSTAGIGSDLAGKASGGRRLIAVVYADMVGYSRLISLDDAGTLRRLRILRRALIDPAIREHGGHVVQTGGDSLLVAFDSIDGAVRCAVKLQQQVPVYDGDQPPDRRIRFRIGINIADVIPDGTDLHGDGVNIAARLESKCPVGGVCISRAVRDHVHGRLDLPFETIGPLILKNIPHPVEAFVLRLDPAADELSTAGARGGTWVRSRTAMLAGLTGLLLIGSGWWLYRGVDSMPPATPLPSTLTPAATRAYTPPDIGLAKAPRLSVAVLPFGNLSGDSNDDYVADGITEDVTTDLSRIPGMFVVARETAYTYRGKAIDVRKLGEELGVRYVLEGSVRKLGDALRVNAQLIGTDTGAHLWADRFDQQLHDLSAGQEEIVRRIGETLNVALTDLESARSRRERPTNPDAFDLILRARSIGLHPQGPQEKAARITLLERAAELDPTSILAMTELARELINNEAQYFGDPTMAGRARAARLIADAAAINPNDLNVLGATCFLLYSENRYAEAISALRRLLDENPNAFFAYGLIGVLLTFTGRTDEAIPMLETPIRRDARSPYIAIHYDHLGFALLLAEKNEESIIWTQRALAANPNRAAGWRAQYNLRLAAAHARLGHVDEARRTVTEANRLWPYDTVRMHWPDDPSSHVYAAQIVRFQAALRLAGHRDHAEEDADFGVARDGTLHGELAGLTPTTLPGATTIRTVELERLLAERNPVVVDPLLYSWGRSIPGAIGLERAGWGGNTFDAAQDRLSKKMQAMTKGDLAKPIVAAGFNSERFDGYNLALRLVALGYTNVYWYRGGREAWEVAGLPETAVDVQNW